MHINIAEADLSHALLLIAIVGYALAMLAYAADFAFGRQRLTGPAPVAASTAAATAAAEAPAGAQAQPVAVGAARGSGPASGGLPDAPAPAGPAPAGACSDEPGTPGRRARRWERAGLTLAIAGLAAHVTAILLRGIAEDRVPWGNMYEFIVAISGMAVIAMVAAILRYRAHYIGLFVLAPVVFALGVAVAVIYTPAGALVPALQSYWIAIHVTAMIVASGLFIVGAVSTVLYLAAERHERREAAGLPSRLAGILEHLPRALVMDRLAYRAVLFAFPVWTFGIMAYAIWADNAWGRYWGWDPERPGRSSPGWCTPGSCTPGHRGLAGRAAYIQLIGFGCLMFNLIGINLWVTGLHSYAKMPH
jgi:cytochrome c-type biogenesis protein CcsB